MAIVSCAVVICHDLVSVLSGAWAARRAGRNSSGSAADRQVLIATASCFERLHGITAGATQAARTRARRVNGGRRSALRTKPWAPDMERKMAMARDGGINERDSGVFARSR